MIGFVRYRYQSGRSLDVEPRAGEEIKKAKRR
jgi:hypothetical protein